MKNYDLIWARDHAHLTQEAAAELMGVNRRTFVRWENGEVPIPARKWQRFLELTHTDVSAIPKHREYDAEGFPVGFDRAPYETDSAGEEKALEAVEGEEYAARARVRYRLMLLRWRTPAEVEREMLLYDAVPGASLV